MSWQWRLDPPACRRPWPPCRSRPSAPLLSSREGFVHVREQDAIDQEPRAVRGTTMGVFADPLGQGDDRGDCFVGGGLAPDHLDQFHAVDRAEEVHPDESPRGRGRGGASG